MSFRRARWILSAGALFLALAVLGLWWWTEGTGGAGADRGRDLAGRTEGETAQGTMAGSRISTEERRDSYRKAMAEALALENPGKRSAAFGQWIRDWYAADPEGALAYLQGMPRQAEYTAGLLVVLGGMAQSNAERALQLAAAMASRPEDTILYNAIFDDLAKRDPVGAARLRGLVPTGEARENATRALAEEWMASEPEAAMAWAKNLENPDERGAAMEAALAILARTEPAQSIALAREWLSGDARERALTSGLRKLVKTDPLAAGKLLKELEPGATQTAAALDVARAMAVAQPEAALAWLAELPAGDIQTQGLNNVLDVWAQHDPEAAKRHVAGLPAGPVLDAAAGHLALTIAATKPELVFDWAEQLPSESARNAAYVAIASSWARTDPAAATKWAGGFPTDSPARKDAIRSALSYWALQDAGAASEFVPTLSVTEQPEAIVMVAPALAQRDADRAISWAAAMPDADIRAIATDAVVTRWAESQPKDAAAWVMTQPDDRARVDQARAVVERWVEGDAVGAVSWIKSLPRGATKDGAIDAAAAVLERTDRVQAEALAAMIASKALREARQEQLRNTPRP